MKMKMELNKKADGMAFNVIIGAVIALAVMIIVIMIFANKAGDISDFYSQCEKTGVNPTAVTNCPVGAGCECPDGKFEYTPLRKVVTENGKVRVSAICCVERFA
jgi:hypothetical protein